MTLDDMTPVAYPNRETWGMFYEKFRLPLVNGLNRKYSYADREDAVEEAFHKLMHLKDREAYGDNLPDTEAKWYGALYWQARAKLSHMRERGERHAEYIKKAVEELSGIFACGFQGMSIDSELRSRALVRALEMFREEQDVSRRDLNVYVLRMSGVRAKEVASRLGITANNVDQIKYRVGILLRKRGPRCFVRALRQEARHSDFDSAAA